MLHRYSIWRQDPAILLGHCENGKMFSELHIEHFHTVVQRALSRNMPMSFDVILSTAEKATCFSKALSQIREHNPNALVEDSLRYRDEANRHVKTRDAIGVAMVGASGRAGTIDSSESTNYRLNVYSYLEIE